MGCISMILVESSEEIDERWETAFDGPADEFDVAGILSQYSLAESWKERDEDFSVAGENISAEHLEIILRAMRKASKKAKRSGKDVFACTIP